jgi:hypothetical protein
MIDATFFCNSGSQSSCPTSGPQQYRRWGL